MPASEDIVRVAAPGDFAEVGALLDRFNTEYDAPTPGAEYMARRVEELAADGDTVALLAGDGPDGVAVFRLRDYLWGDGREAYLEELYVVPERRGEGLGRALLEETIRLAREAGAVRVDLGTGEDDAEARGLYESAGFTNDENEPGGPRMLFYEREI